MWTAIWILPAAYVAIGFAADAGARLALAGPDRRTARAFVGGVAGVAAVVAACALLVPLAVGHVRDLPTRGALNERDAIGWAVQQHRPGDLTIVLAGSGHAVTWYVDHAPTPRRARRCGACQPEPRRGVGLADIVCGYQRMLVYGYLENAEVRATASQLRIDLAALGTVVAEHPSGPAAIVLLVALRPTAERAPAADCYVR